MAAPQIFTKDVVGANLLSTLQTDILAQTDWARPNSATFPTLYKATTTRGAQMCIDLNIAAADLNKMSLRAYRTHDGTTGVDSADTFIRYKRTTGGAFSTNTYHYVLSLSKEHFFLSIEGPRAGETGADSATYGSLRNYIFLCDLVPYNAGDTTAAVILGGPQTNAAPTLLALMHQVRVSRNGANTLAWTPGHLNALTFPQLLSTNNGSVAFNEQRVAAMDSNNYHLSPYVFFDNAEGERGRLSDIFYAGMNYSELPTEVPSPPIGQSVTYNSKTYRLHQLNRNDGQEQTWGGLGFTIGGNTAWANYSHIIGIPAA